VSRTRSKAGAGTASVEAGVARLADDYQQVALVLQGGGALGAYQCGVYEALHAAGVRPHWIAGTSIGAINAAIIAGNAEADRMARLKEFWTGITRPAGTLAWPLQWMAESAQWLPPSHALSTGVSASSALASLALGQQGFFTPRTASPFLYCDGSAAATSFYDTAPLRDTLLRLVDFDRINGGEVRLSVGASNVRNGNVHYFDSAMQPLRVEHIMASAALPPAFPAVEIDGESWWDGGIVSNTPLEHVLAAAPRRDSLILQVDLWSARGERPATIMDVLEREKDIRFSSRTRYGTDSVARMQKLRNALDDLFKTLPKDALPAGLAARLKPWRCDRVFNIVHLIYQAKHHEEQYKDYAFDAHAMREHWASGLADMQRTLAERRYFAMPERGSGVVTHDIHRALVKARAESA
jgi:NTE family protein